MDATKRPLRIPPDFATYAEKHEIFETYKHLLEQLLIHKPVDPLTFLIEQLKKDNDNVPQVIIHGPPSAGKRSIAKMVCSKLKTAHLHPDSIIEEAELNVKNEALALKAEGKPIPTDMWVEMIRGRVSLFDCVKKGWVMEGFPQTREQALALQACGISPKHFILLEAPDTVLIERASGKRVDPKTGDVYHVTFDWPSDPEVAGRVTEVTDNTEDAVIEQLVLYHRHADAILKCYPNQKTINADQPKADVCAQVMSYLSTKPRSMAPHTPRVVLLGPTGSGKSVQATLLANKYNIVDVSMGQLLKQAIADESKSGAACKAYVERGAMVPDAIVLNVLKERLSQLDCASRGWVLHGYPKTREQGEQLAGAGLGPNRVFFLDLPNDSVLERLMPRSTDPITGSHYHGLLNPARTETVRDRLETHPADEEAAIRKRLADFHAYAEELEDYYAEYRSQSHVNADQDPHTVFEGLESRMVNQIPASLVQ